MDLELQDRVYLLTGASGGLGRATALRLVTEGARVVVTGRDPDSLAALEDACGADNLEALVADNADPETPQRLVDAALRRWGRLDGLLVSVGGPPAGPAHAMADEEWRSAFESVFLGAVRTVRTVVPHLEPGGAVVLVLSTSVKAPVSGLGISNGLRPGLAMVAKEMADEFGPSHGIRVNTLLPGRIDTDRVRQLDAGNADPSAARRRWEETIPLGRYGLPEEFGDVAAFLLSPRASFVNGVALPVDGGLTRAL